MPTERSQARRAARLAPNRILMLLEAFVCVVWAKLLLHAAPFRFTVLTIGRKNVLSPEVLDAASLQRTGEIGWALRAIGLRIPLLRQCLPQAMAAQWMSRRRKITSTLYLGTRREAGNMTAHAWLRAGSRLVVGGENCDAFQVVGFFGDA